MIVSYLFATALAAAVQDYRPPPPPPPPSRMTAPKTNDQSEEKKPAPVPQLVIPSSPPGKALKDLPNTTVRYYNVAGKNLKGAIQSITEQRPKDATGQPITAATNWSVKTEFSKRTDGKGGCSIAAAKATFSAAPELPRLENEAAFKKQELNSWQAYAAGLEVGAAAKLWYAHDHVADVEKAILGATCDTAEAAGAAAIQQLRAQANAVRPPAATTAAASSPTN
jgi:predicted secreted Zn-dependent protease